VKTILSLTLNELRRNGGMIVLGSFDGSAESLRHHVKHPDQIGGAETAASAFSWTTPTKLRLAQNPQAPK
jgi:hypothetical protein